MLKEVFKMYDFSFGSKTAKGGFNLEKRIASKFENWQRDSLAPKWLQIMGYPLNKIEQLEVVHIPSRLPRVWAQKLKVDD